jgi:hypothetical protein
MSSDIVKKYREPIPAKSTTIRRRLVESSSLKVSILIMSRNVDSCT